LSTPRTLRGQVKSRGEQLRKKIKKLPKNENCLEAHVSFILGGDNLRPDLITKVLKIQPTYCVKKGDIHTGSYVRGNKAGTGVWFISTKGELKSTNLEEHLIYLINKIGKPSTNFYKLVTELRLRVMFRCFFMSATGQGGPDISIETLRKIVNLGFGLEFDFYSAV
jgi:hypothetical protein